MHSIENNLYFTNCDELRSCEQRLGPAVVFLADCSVALLHVYTKSQMQQHQEQKSGSPNVVSGKQTQQYFLSYNGIVYCSRNE